jgi:pilus assembly protein Flp/PilA
MSCEACRSPVRDTRTSINDVFIGRSNEENRVAAMKAGREKERTAVSHWYDPVKRFLKAEDGPTAVEYAVMLALIIAVCIAAITTVGTNSNKVFNNAALNAAAGS